MIIKERLGTSDEETVEQIRENPYLQYFLGYKEYKGESPFDPSLFVHFRKRFRKKTLFRINASIACKALYAEKKKAAAKSSKNEDDDPGCGSGSNRGKLLKDKKRKAIRKQLGYVGRNLKIIDKLSSQVSLLLLSRHQYKNLLVIHELYRQQKWMYDQREYRITDRIVSISQPHVRPIKRGKARAAAEFGAKISASLVIAMNQ